MDDKKRAPQAGKRVGKKGRARTSQGKAGGGRSRSERSTPARSASGRGSSGGRRAKRQSKPSARSNRPQLKEALSNLGGEIITRGDGVLSVPLRAAMQSQGSEGPVAGTDSDSEEKLRLVDKDELTHGFHAHPAKMHPGIARVILREMSQRTRGTVLDPFCGSGTVAIEALCAGWRSLGSDLDPLAIRIARVKTARRDRSARNRFLSIAGEVAAASEERVRSRTEVRAELSPEERRWYDVHVLKEMAGLLAEIKKVESEPDRAALEMVFSSLVVKFSRQRSETAERIEEKRIRKGLVTEFFARKSEELAGRWQELFEACERSTPSPRFVQSDARKLVQTLGGEFKCPLILTSPPYGGTYDYALHHRRRHAWLGIDTRNLTAKEIGSRRRLSSPSDPRKAIEQWNIELRATLVMMSKLLEVEGLAVLLIGDAQIGSQRIDADLQLEELAEKCGLRWRASASQPRNDPHSKQARKEHLVALEKVEE